MQKNIVHDWLNRSGITDAIISDFNIHEGIHPIMGDCIVIPVHDSEGNFVFNKYRRNPLSEGGSKYMYDKGGSLQLYGWFKAKQYPGILMTEGEKDCLVAWSNNIPAVSSTGGANSISDAWQVLLCEKELTICFDNDSAGGHGMAKALMLFPHAFVLFLPDRPGIKDISDYVASGGNLQELMRTRVRFTSLQDVIDDRAKRQSVWQSTWFHDSFIELNTEPEHLPKEQRGYVSADADMLTRAKAYPVTNLLKFNREHKALCLWHADSTPSMHYFPKDNNCYCFSCGKRADSVDVYRALHNCSFKEAISKLSTM